LKSGAAITFTNSAFNRSTIARRRSRRELRTDDRGIAAGPVVHDNLDTWVLAELLCERPRNKVSTSTGRKWNDEADGLGGIPLRVNQAVTE
jgi:hypothetical protein